MKSLNFFFGRFNGLFLKVIPNQFINLKTIWFSKTMMEEKDYNEIPFSKDLKENLLDLIPEGQKKPEQIRFITKDAIKYYLLYGITPDEYYLHSFWRKDDSYKKNILSRKKKDEMAIKSLGKKWRPFFNQLKDKWEFFQLTRDFFMRDVCKAETESDFTSFNEFCTKHPIFVAKPRLASCGIGVHKVDVNHGAICGVRKVFEHYLKQDSGMWLFEEFIEQDPRMAAWHPSSVNTIRIPSIMTKDGPVVILPLFRTGKNGNVVDNCHNDGGLMAVPDAKTGVLLTDGYDVFTNVVETHPNSGMKFKGWQVPEWDSLIKTAAELHKSLPKQHKYVGFDFALTKDGWVVVEGNWGNFPHQVCVGYGIRKEFERLMKS